MHLFSVASGFSYISLVNTFLVVPVLADVLLC